MLPFLIVLLTLLILAMWKRHDMVGTVVVLLVNWALLSTICWITDNRFPWLMFLTVDYLSALALFAMMKTRWQGGVAGIYVVQLICHAAYAFSRKGGAIDDHYWWMLTLTGWSQLVVMGGWMIAGLVGRFGRADGGAPSDYSADRAFSRKAGEP